MKPKKIKMFLLLTLIIISVSSFIFDSKAQHDPGYYHGWFGTAPDGKWTCTCPAPWAPNCACDYQG